MFGLIRPCHHQLNGEWRRQYLAHMCGTCLSLRDSLGQSARPALNQDALTLSLLAEHLESTSPDGSTDPARVLAGRCVLRGMQRASVLDPASPAARYAAMASMIMLQVSVEDHAEDRDRGASTARLVHPLVSHHGRRAMAQCARLGVDLSPVAACVAHERELRRRAGLTVDDYLVHTEEAFGIGFAGVATVVNRPDATSALTQLGRAYGGTAALIDAFEDYDADRQRGQFNVLAASWPGHPRAEQWRRGRAELAVRRDAIEAALVRLDAREGVVWRLLVDTLGDRAATASGVGRLASSVASPASGVGPPPAYAGTRDPARPIDRPVTAHHPRVKPGQVLLAALGSVLLLQTRDDKDPPRRSCCNSCDESCGDAFVCNSCGEICDNCCHACPSV
jgi:hypothetical protein